MKKRYSNHRSIYISHFGSIPKDENGRSYEIHHIDGDKTNNNIENLIAVSIQEHYNIHYEKGEFGACLAIARRMKMSVEEISSISRKVQLERSKNGTNPFSGPNNISKRKVEDGTHNLLGDRNPVHRLIKEGKHNFQQPGYNAYFCKKRMENGTHNFLGDKNPNKNMPKVVCPHCNKTGGRNLMKRWHFDNCKSSS
jgi:hypothetical protein